MPPFISRHHGRHGVASSHSAFPLLAAALLLSCGERAGTPLPEPPALDPLDPGLLELDTVGASILANSIAVVAEAGAVSAGERISVTNLSSGGRATSSAGDDGSFRVDLVGETGEVLRVEVDRAAGRTPPTDVVIGDDVLTPHDPPSCLTLVPATFANVEALLSVGLQNDCDEAVLIRTSALLIDDGSFSFDSEDSASEAEPFSLPAGQSFLGEARVGDPSSDGDVLRFDVEVDGARQLVAISLRQR